jgi:serine/threonine protein kinase
MAVDPKRLQAVFLLAAEAAGPADQAAILDRECGPDAEMRQRVEALLRAYQGPGDTLDKPPAGAPPPSSDEFLLLTPSRLAAAAPAGPAEGEGRLSLDFLGPPARLGPLGRLGHYEVLEVLGRGGFGIVVRAFDEVLQRGVAIKVLAPQLAEAAPARQRFLREARAAGRVRHENVVQIYAVEEQPLPYLVMEYVPGQSLQQRLDQAGPLEVAELLRIGEQIARGLAAAHAQGLIHRDIKPANVLLESSPEQRVKITDFGLARAAGDASLTQSGMTAGTPLYMAPEQARGETLDHRADLFSLGSVLYALASGRPPFRAGAALAVLKRVAEDTPRPIREIVPEVPQWLCDLIARLHAKAPAERFQSAAEVADLLGRYLAYVQQPLVVPRPDTVETPRQRKPRRVAALAAAAVALVVLGPALTYPLWRPAGPPPVAPGPPGPKGERPAQAAAAAPAERPAPAPAAPEPPGGRVLQGRAAMRDALIDFTEPEGRFGAAAHENAVRRGDQCNAFLVRFDLAQLGVPPKARVAKATLSFYVWDPSSRGKTKVCAFPLKTAWDEATVSWRRPAAGQSWRGGDGFAFGADTGPAGPAVVVQPDREGSDTADPPIEYQLDVTHVVRSWLDGGAPNHGLAIAPVIDPGVDEGLQTRFQVYGSEHDRAQYTPKLTVQVRR